MKRAWDKISYKSLYFVNRPLRLQNSRTFLKSILQGAKRWHDRYFGATHVVFTCPLSVVIKGVWLHQLDISLDPIHRSPFGHLMKFTQRSFPRYVFGLSTAFTD